MSRWIVTFIVVSVIIVLVEFYTFQAIKTLTKNKFVKWIWVLIGLAIYFNLLYVLFATPRSQGQTKAFQWAIGLLLKTLELIRKE